jgi:hypothetical protein
MGNKRPRTSANLERERPAELDSEGTEIAGQGRLTRGPHEAREPGNRSALTVEVHSPRTNVHNLNRAGILTDASTVMPARLRLGVPAGGFRSLWMNPSGCLWLLWAHPS